MHGDDDRDLQRSAWISSLGYGLKLANPALLVVLVLVYGAAAFGLYSLAVIVVRLAARAALVGLDKGILWWRPRQTEAGGAAGIQAAMSVVTLATLALTALVLALGGLGLPREACATLRVMALGMPALVWMDYLAHACMAHRKLEAQVLVRDGLTPILGIVLALALHAAGARELGLALAFTASHVAGLLCMAVVYRRQVGRLPWPGRRLRLPRELWRYAVPMCLSDLATCLLQRVDMTMVGVLVADPALVGVYAVIVRISNQILDIRRSFDPIVLAILSAAAARRERARLQAAFSSATRMVAASQVPIFVFLLVFAGPLLPLFGPRFHAAVASVMFISGFWLLHSFSSLPGVVVAAHGRSRLTLLNTLVTIAVQVAGCLALIPGLGLLGASLALGAAYTCQAALQLLEMRWITGGWSYDRTVGRAALQVLGALGATLLAWGLAHGLGAGPLASRGAAFGAFVVVYGAERLTRAARTAWRARPRGAPGAAGSVASAAQASAG